VAVRRLLGAVLVALGLALLVRALLVEPLEVATGSMAPTLRPGDHLLVWKGAYGVRLPLGLRSPWPGAPPRRGDVIAFRDPRDPGARLVKRVVGLPGEVVELREQVLHLDGVAQLRQDLGEAPDELPGGPGRPAREEACRRLLETVTAGPGEAGGMATRSYEVLQCRRKRAGRVEGPFGPVAPGHVFVLGDNRDRSEDGRAGGWEVPLEAVDGKVVLVGWSTATLAGGARTDRLFKPVE
jgi:signal peptidase I